MPPFFSNHKLVRALCWFDFRKRHLGMYAYILNRLSALGLVAYLYLHLAVLSLLAGGPAQWDSFIAAMRSPFFLLLDVILLAGLLIHGLNGLRVALVGFGVGVKAQRALFIVLMALAALGLTLGAIGIFRA